MNKKKAFKIKFFGKDVCFHGCVVGKCPVCKIIKERDEYREIAVMLLRELKIWNEDCSDGIYPDRSLISEAENLLNEGK